MGDVQGEDDGLININCLGTGVSMSPQLGGEYTLPRVIAPRPQR